MKTSLQKVECISGSAGSFCFFLVFCFLQNILAFGGWHGGKGGRFASSSMAKAMAGHWPMASTLVSQQSLFGETLFHPELLVYLIYLGTLSTYIPLDVELEIVFASKRKDQCHGECRCATSN